MSRRALHVFAIAALAAVGLACGRPANLSAPAPGSSPGSFMVSGVQSVRRGPTPNTVLIDVAVPSGGEDCVRNLRADVFDQVPGSTIFVHVLFDSANVQTYGVCPTTAIATVTLTMPDPIGDRPLAIDERVWTPDGTGYRQCDVNLGCNPPADHCAQQWIQQARSGLDVPQHGFTKAEHCDQSWLILTVDANTAVCGAGGRPGCSAPPNVTRYFLRFDNGWRYIISTTTGGCAAVKAKAADFPEGLCRALEPTR
jgi:hypothetical protein